MYEYSSLVYVGPVIVGLVLWYLFNRRRYSGVVDDVLTMKFTEFLEDWGNTGEADMDAVIEILVRNRIMSGEPPMKVVNIDFIEIDSAGSVVYSVKVNGSRPFVLAFHGKRILVSTNQMPAIYNGEELEIDGYDLLSVFRTFWLSGSAHLFEGILTVEETSNA